MLHTFWSVKGGSGVTVTVAGYSAWLGRHAGPTTIVDLCGDQPAALGMAQPRGEGWTDWLASPEGGRAALDRLVVPVDERLSLLPMGTGRPWPVERVADLVDALDRRPRVVVDAGLPRSTNNDPAADPLFVAFAEVGRSTLVVRSCYLGLRRARQVRSHIDDLVVVLDPDRALTARDIGEVVRVPVAAAIEVDPSVGRSVDAGTLVRREHRAVDRAFDRAWTAA